MNRRAFTLMETLVSLSTVAVIAGAIMSVMVVATRAMPRAGDRVNSTNDAARLLSQLSAEIAPAQQVAQADKNAVEFTTPDTDGDGAADTIRYEWDGREGSDLVRTFNGKSAIAASGVTAFEATWFTRDSTVAWGGSPAAGAETTLAAFEDASASGSTITLTKWHGQYVLPVLPSRATAYSVTSVGITLERGTSIGVTYNVDIRPDASGKPSGTILATATASASAAKSARQTVTATFSSPPSLAPGVGFWIVVRVGVALGTDSALVKAKVANGRQQYALTSDSGLTWTATADSSLVFQVNGKVTQPQDLGVTRLDGAELALQLGADASTRARRGVVLVASPLAPAAPTSEKPAQAPDLNLISNVLDILDRLP